MRAEVGDRVIVRGTFTGVHDRDGKIVALHHADGTPPWDVLWSESGRTTLLFPGPDTILHHYAHEDGTEAAPPADPSEQLHTFAP
ncbi:DUF1918 domain-containing protein [Kitasatospora paranensis]|uniref:DUF1918 domain-containing protein n=1 Tax=Kitasatospora paranensis TaxID=258053 RepID=A0ABW2FP46_9ACTN